MVNNMKYLYFWLNGHRYHPQYIDLLLQAMNSFDSIDSFIEKEPELSKRVLIGGKNVSDAL